MKINDLGFFLGNKKYGENSMIIYILSKNNGLIKSFSRKSEGFLSIKSVDNGHQ